MIRRDLPFLTIVAIILLTSSALLAASPWVDTLGPPGDDRGRYRSITNFRHFDIRGIVGEHEPIETVTVNGAQARLFPTTLRPLNAPEDAHCRMFWTWLEVTPETELKVVVNGDEENAVVLHPAERDEIMRRLGTLAEDHPDDPNVLFRLGAEEERETAVDRLRQVLQLAPDCAEAHAELALALWRYDVFSAVLRHSEMAVELLPGNPWMHYVDGFMLQRADLYHQAVEATQKALELDPQNSRWATTLADSLTRTDEVQRAGEVLREAIKRRPDDANPYYHLAMYALLYDDAPKKAEQLARRAVELEPLDHFYRSGLGLVLEQQGKPAEALKQYRKATEVAPDTPFAWSRLGNELLERDMHAEAEEAFQKSLQLNPEYIPPLNGLGRLRGKQGRWEDAPALHQKTIEQWDGFSISHFLLARAYYNLERYEEAREAVDRALELRPSYGAARALKRELSTVGE